MPPIDPMSKMLGELTAELRKQNGTLTRHLEEETEFRHGLDRVTADLTEMRAILLGSEGAPGIAAEVRELHAWLVGGKIGMKALRWFTTIAAGAIGLSYMVEQLLRSFSRQ